MEEKSCRRRRNNNANKGIGGYSSRASLKYTHISSSTQFSSRGRTIRSYLSSCIDRKNVENVIKYKVDIYIYIYIYIYQEHCEVNQQKYPRNFVFFLKVTIIPLGWGEMLELKKDRKNDQISRSCKIKNQCHVLITICTTKTE
jgi:hypothetical protein